MSVVDSISSENQIAELASNPSVRRASRSFKTRADELTSLQIRICEVPAPPFGEAERSLLFLDLFREAGLTDTKIDEVGNCAGFIRGRRLNPLLVLSAHLDTVFPMGTDCTVRRRNGKLFAPGIADDGCGLVALAALATAIKSAQLNTEGSILFVATVGEEGEGDLRGVRHLFTNNELAHSIDAFISFDGPDVERITNSAIGSRRYRATLKGCGGHSWGDFGVPNPIHALGRAVSMLASYPAPADPRTTFNVGRISGGTGTNVIPAQASIDVDLRSESPDELQRLDAFFRRSLHEAVEESAGRGVYGRLDLELTLIGDRPSGKTSADTQIVRFAELATRAVGVVPRLDRSSTDSNIPISLGIPAITLGAGGYSGNTHTIEEWYDPRDRHLALTRNLLLALALVGVSE